MSNVGNKDYPESLAHVFPSIALSLRAALFSFCKKVSFSNTEGFEIVVLA